METIITNKYDHLTIEQMQKLREQMNKEIAELIEQNDMIISGLVTLMEERDTGLTGKEKSVTTTWCILSKYTHN